MICCVAIVYERKEEKEKRSTYEFLFHHSTIEGNKYIAKNYPKKIRTSTH